MLRRKKKKKGWVNRDSRTMKVRHNDKKTEQPRSVGAGVLESVMGTRKSVTPAPVTGAPRRVTSTWQPSSKNTPLAAKQTCVALKYCYLAIIGSARVFIFRWNEDRFSSTLVGTVDVNFKTKKVCVEEEIEVQVWDTAGRSNSTKSPPHTTAAPAIMVVYDISDKGLENVSGLNQSARRRLCMCV